MTLDGLNISCAIIILIHTSVKLVTLIADPCVMYEQILIHTSVKLVTAPCPAHTRHEAILIHTSVKLVTKVNHVTGFNGLF